MLENFALPAGYVFACDEEAFTLTARLSCPASQARCLAVTAASWVLDAVGGESSIRWPNRVMLGEKPVCDIGCRATVDGIMFTFRPNGDVLPLPREVFAERVVRAAVPALDGYPENQAELIGRYCEHCVTLMKFVNVTYRGMPVYGFAFAVDKHGGLMVMTQDSRTVITIYGGEAELAAQEPEAPEPPPMPHM